MFSSGPNYNKLKTNLRLAINRLKLLEKKKTELALKARKEIADYISTGKLERAKIRVEHIIREDYLVEAMEVTEMYCDLLLARFGLIQQMKDLDEGLAEAISSLIWAAPRLMTDVAELKLIADQFSLKYGKPYAQACREQQVATISERLIHKLSVQAPPKILVEKYLVEIAKNYNIEYEPDPQVMREGEPLDPLINFDEKNNRGGGGSGGDGGMNIPPVGFPGAPMMGPGPPGPVPTPFSYPQQPSMPLPDPSVQPTPAYQPSIHPIRLDDSSSINNQNITSQNAFMPSLLVCNPQSLTNCFEDFESVIKESKPDVVVVSETWFSENKPASNYNMEGYKMFNDDREIRRGGGVAVYVKEGLGFKEAQVKAPRELECVWVELGDNLTRNRCSSLMICGIYHPPSAPTAPLLMDQIVNTVLDIRKRDPGICTIIAGDFNNLHHERLYSSLGLENLVKEPTHANSVIDLILTDKPTAFVKPVLLPPIGKSKHHCVFVKPEPFMTDANVANTLSQMKI